MRSEPTVAAIICVGPGHEEMAQDAIGSACRQFPPFDQILVCFDSAVKDLSTGWSGRPAPEVIRSNIHPGKSTTFNFALHHVRTQWAIHFGADDVLEEHALADFALLLRDQPGADLYYSDCNVIRGKDLTGPKTLVDNGTFSRDAVRACEMKHMSLFFQVERMTAIGGYDVEHYNWSGQTKDFWLRYTLNPGVRVVKARHPFVCARKGSGVHSLKDAGRRFREAQKDILGRVKAGEYEGWATA